MNKLTSLGILLFGLATFVFATHASVPSSNSSITSSDLGPHMPCAVGLWPFQFPIGTCRPPLVCVPFLFVALCGQGSISMSIGGGSKDLAFIFDHMGALKPLPWL